MLNNQSLRPFPSFLFLDKSTGPYLPFVALTLWHLVLLCKDTNSSVPPMSIDNFTNDDGGVNFYTWLKTLTKFNFIMRTIGPAAHCLNYIYHRVSNISVPDQFCLVLCKLRHHTTNFEHFQDYLEFLKKNPNYLIYFLYGFYLWVSNGRKLTFGHQSILLSTTVHQI